MSFPFYAVPGKPAAIAEPGFTTLSLGWPRWHENVILADAGLSGTEHSNARQTDHGNQGQTQLVTLNPPRRQTTGSRPTLLVGICPQNGQRPRIRLAPDTASCLVACRKPVRLQLLGNGSWRFQISRERESKADKVHGCDGNGNGISSAAASPRPGD